MFFDDYDTPVFRPPSEANSFILRVTRGCAHNKCTYCNMYRGVPFQVLTDEEIARQMALAYSYNRDGVRRVFLADGDALVLSTERLSPICSGFLPMRRPRIFCGKRRKNWYSCGKQG